MAKFFWDYMHSVGSTEHLYPLEDALGMQDDFANRKIAGDEYNFLLFAEHEPIYCCPQDKIQDLDKKRRFYRGSVNLPAPFLSIPESHGGSLTFHGPGQLNCYVIACLEELGVKGPIEINSVIDEIIKSALQAYQIKGYTLKELCEIKKLKVQKKLLKLGAFSLDAKERREFMSAQGVWIIDKEFEIKKIASRALRIVRYFSGKDGASKHLTKFGFAINVYTDILYFQYIYPCGLDIQMTSIQELTGRKIALTDLARVIAHNFQKKFETKKALPVG